MFDVLGSLADKLFTKVIPRMNTFRYKKFYLDLELKLEEERLKDVKGTRLVVEGGTSGSPQKQPDTAKVGLDEGLI